MFNFKALIIGIATGAAALIAPVVAFAANVLLFPVSTVYLSNNYLGAPVSQLSRTLSGHTSYFTLSRFVDGTVEETFSVQFNVVPASWDLGPYSYNATLLSASWDRTAFPSLTLWSTTGAGGLTISVQRGDHGLNLYNLFQANADFGEAQIYDFGPGQGVPEPSTWLMMLVGVGAVGATLRQAGRRKLSAD